MRSHSHDVLHVEEADDDAVPLQDDHAPIGGQGSAKDKFYGTTLSVWQIYEKAQKLKVSLRATALHSDDSGNSWWYWQRKILAMYLQQSRDSFCETRSLAIVTDASTHGTQDLQVSIAYDAVSDAAVYCTNQVMSVSKKVAPGELNVDDTIERILARQEAERIKSYRFLQALSHQVSVLTNGRMDLSSFEPSNEWASLVKPLVPGSFRHASAETRSIDMSGHQMFPLDAASNVHMLTLLMDQGSVGMAAGGFMMGSHMMVSCDWDIYHRLANDMKLAAEKCGLVQAQLACQYIWGINYKPFGTGAFFAEKQEALSYFFEVESFDFQTATYQYCFVLYCLVFVFTIAFPTSFLEVGSHNVTASK